MAAVRFVPGPDQGDAEIVVLGVELHEDIVVIDVATAEIGAIRHPTVRRRLPRVKVEDDLGNTYRGKPLERYGAGWSGAVPIAHYAMEFRPPVPSDARFLRVTFGGMYADNRTVIVML
jgi:hypothetical protein